MKDQNKNSSGLDMSLFEGVDMEESNGSEPISIRSGLASSQPKNEILKKAQYFFGPAALARLAIELDVPPERQQEVLRRYAKNAVEGILDQVKCPENTGVLLNLDYPETLDQFKKQVEGLVTSVGGIEEYLDLGKEEYEQFVNLAHQIRKEMAHLVEKELDEHGLERKAGVLGRKYGEGGFGGVFSCRVGNENLVAKMMKPFEYDEESDPPSYFEYPELIEATRDSKVLVRYHGTLDMEKNDGKAVHLDFGEELKGYKTMDEYLYWDMGGFEGGNRYRNLDFFLEKLFLPMLKGVKDLHDRKLIHGDLKEGNVLILPNEGQPEVKLGDYDLVRRSGFVPKGNRVMGSPAFMSPEQVMATKQTEKSDIYSLGMMLYYAFGGHMEKGLEAQMKRALREMDVSMLECPRQLKSLISRCLSLSPEGRPTIDGVIREIEKLIKDPMFEAEILMHLPGNQETQEAPAMKEAA